ncbi:substrate-binding domain-containing protein [uncultured Thiothrix sp.]|uniref:substrate-binding domain-containing protein n=1 Tax=uncultured Thiothrix sp. TaxID=223185 RepID=UPI00261878C8|nr:substrate-binding domain-containing protein [uncultured Thiothrix sp.]
MHRVTIAQLMQETGLSRATIDRVINKRGKVHPRTLQVVQSSLEKLSQTSQLPTLHSDLNADLVSRVGHGMMMQLLQVWNEIKPNGQFHDMYQATDEQVLKVVEQLCKDLSKPLIITAKNNNRLVNVLKGARAKGKRVITLISDLSWQARDCFVGIDNRAAGLTAAFLIGRMLGHHPTSVGLVLGHLSFHCHEDREIGFRTCLRSKFPKVMLLGEAQGEDSTELTRKAVLEMLKENPSLGAIYNVGGGNTGLAAALKAANRHHDILVVGHEVNAVTSPLLQEGVLDFVIASDPCALLKHALELANEAELNAQREQQLLDFGVYTRFNLPNFAENTHTASSSKSTPAI